MPHPRGPAHGRSGFLVFVGGACSLAAEMAGGRRVAPYVVASNLVWATIMGLILLSLSVGYWIGGTVADRYLRATTLWLVTGASLIDYLRAGAPGSSRSLDTCENREFLRVGVNNFSVVDDR